MVKEVKQVGERRYRETFGRYYEDFEVGDTYEHRPGRTITETENYWFTLLTMNTHPLHFDEEYAKLLAASNRDVNLDIGERVFVQEWSANRTARVQYRGSLWEARLAPGAAADSGEHLVSAVEGNWLVLVPAAPRH